MTNIFKMTMFVEAGLALFNITGYGGASDDGTVDCVTPITYSNCVY